MIHVWARLRLCGITRYTNRRMLYFTLLIQLLTLTLTEQNRGNCLRGDCPGGTVRSGRAVYIGLSAWDINVDREANETGRPPGAASDVAVQPTNRESHRCQLTRSWTTSLIDSKASGLHQYWTSRAHYRVRQKVNPCCFSTNYATLSAKKLLSDVSATHLVLHGQTRCRLNGT